MAWWKRGTVTGRICRMPTVVSFYLRAGLAISVSDHNEVIIIFQVAALRGYMVAAVAYSAVSAAVHE